MKRHWYYLCSGVWNQSVELLKVLVSEVKFRLKPETYWLERWPNHLSRHMKAVVRENCLLKMPNSELVSYLEKHWFERPGTVWGEQQFRFFKDECDSNAARYPSKRSFHVVFQEIEALKQKAREGEVTSFLEVGSLQGRMLLPLAGDPRFHAIGIDLNKDAVEQGQKWFEDVDNVNLYCCDALEYIRQRDERLDYLMLCTVLAYLPEETVSEILEGIAQSGKVDRIWIYDQQFMCGNGLSSSVFNGYFDPSFTHDFIELLSKYGYRVTRQYLSPAFLSNTVRSDRYFIFLEAEIIES